MPSGSTSSKQIDREDPLPKSKKLTFTAEKPRKPSTYDHIRQSDTGRNSAGFNTFATPLKMTHNKISTPTESDSDFKTKKTEKKSVKELIQNEESRNLCKVLDDLNKKTGKELKVTESKKPDTLPKNTIGTETTQQKVIEKKVVDECSNKKTAGTRNKVTVSKNPENCPKKTSTAKNNFEGTKALDECPNKKTANQKVTGRATRNTSKRKILSPLSCNLQHNSSLFTTISSKSSSRNSSLFSSLSPSPNRNNRYSHNGSLFSTISMESKESHDSSGSVYVSATDSFNSTADSKTPGGNKTKKYKTALPKSNEDAKGSDGLDLPQYTDSRERKNAPFSSAKETKDFGDLHKNTTAEVRPENARFSTRQLRSRKENSSLFSSITSNDSIPPVDKSNGSKLNSMRQENQSSSLISGIEKLNLTEDGQKQTHSESDVVNSSIAGKVFNDSIAKKEICRVEKTTTKRNGSEFIANEGVRNENSTASKKVTDIANREANVSNQSRLSHSSLFSSINSNTSKTHQKSANSDVICISSDSSFDIDADFAQLKTNGVVLCEDSCIKSDRSGFPTSQPNGSARSSALFSTLGNINLTTGVRIRKSKYFFNASDKSISSISEPSCIDSSIVARRNVFCVNETEAHGTEDFTENEARGMGTEDVRNVFGNVNETVEPHDTGEDVSLTESRDDPKPNESSKSTDVIPNSIGDQSKHDSDNKHHSELSHVQTSLKGKPGAPDPKCNGQNRHIDDIFDKTKVFNGHTWVDKINEESFKFKEPKAHDTDKPEKGAKHGDVEKSDKGSKLDMPDKGNDIDLSTWGTNSRGNIKLKVDRYSLSFNFNKLMGRTETTSTETGHDQLSSDIKHSVNISKRKSINRDLRKSVEIKRSVVISSDSDEDTDDEIRVVSKARRKQRILDSTDSDTGIDGRISVSSESEYEDIRPREERKSKFEDIQPKDERKKTKKLLHGLTNDFNEILK